MLLLSKGRSSQGLCLWFRVGIDEKPLVASPVSKHTPGTVIWIDKVTSAYNNLVRECVLKILPLACRHITTHQSVW